MRNTPALLLALFAAALLAFAPPPLPVAAGEPNAGVPSLEPVALTVRTDRPGPRVSPTLYGVFFEEINHAGDGGLYAELVRNRDFEEAGQRGGGESPPGWSLQAGSQAQANIAVDTARPLNAVNGKSLRLEVRALPSGRVSVVNTGYWGMGVKKGDAYRLSLFARTPDLRSPLVASLEGANGQVYARSEITGLTVDWRRFTCRLRSNADDPSARLVLSVAEPGMLWLDVVSLFPVDTWKGRPNGLRADLARMVHAMRPAFLRFPGGCYVEGGDRLADAFRWKTTLGDIAARPGHLNAIWNYRSTDGLGYHEYLQMCEDMGAEPMFVVNCGMSHKEFVPLDQLQPWIQDALDAIEYANGPVTSKWGTLRARNGHPAPFNLRYVEIGNENGMFGTFGGTRQQYAERYRPFYDAIKARYPGIITIANTTIPHPVEILDDHFYNSPAWFWSNVGLYDRRDRKGPRIYVGEYAVTQECGHGNLRAALAEAAFMTGLERNADVVVMASYAPLFVNANDRKWNPDAIVFDSARCYGTPSYYVQKLFAENRPDVVLPAEFTEPPASIARGGIGLGTWQTQAEYRDIEVVRDGKTVYASDFSQGAAGWRPSGGEWKVVEGAYRQSAGGDDRRAVLVEPALNDASNYSLRLKARKLGGAEGFLVMFRVQDPGNFYWWNLGGWANREHGIEKAVGGSKIQVGPHVPGRIETGRWYDIRIEVEGSRIRCYLDGKLVQDVQDRGAPTLAAVAGRVEKTGEIVLKVVNGAETPRTLRIDLQGVRGLKPTARATLLTSGSMEDENSLAQPTKIAPVSRTISGIRPQFAYMLPARSLAILRLNVKESAPPVAFDACHCRLLKR
jgi:alpha-L-arabinofuranosidase